MAELIHAGFSENQRMELRALIRLASEIIAYYWPMRTFVHHNPLHGLEGLHFEEAVSTAQRLLGGKGYLANESFRAYYASGRIQPQHLDGALQAHAEDDEISLGPRVVSHFEVLRVLMMEDISGPGRQRLDGAFEPAPHDPLVVRLAEVLSAVIPPQQADAEGRRSPTEFETVSGWCDRVLGTRLNEIINREMIKWCAAFLDEGHATWPMPGRAKGFYPAWKLLAQHEWSPCAIRNSRKKIAALSIHPEDTLLETMAVLGIDSESWQQYLSLHLAALPGWAAFIKWRADQSEYEWQVAYRIDLTQYLAVRLWYERELVQQVCRERLGVDGNVAALSAEIGQQESAAASAPGKSIVDPAHINLAWKLVVLMRALQIDPAVLTQTPTGNLKTLLGWLEKFPASCHGPIWLQAFEAGYRQELLDQLGANHSSIEQGGKNGLEPSYGEVGIMSVRPQAQAVFCIDVRSETFRRHLEAAGDYETYGFAGFFAVPIRYQALGSQHETDQFPVIVKSKNQVREIPRAYHGQRVFRHRRREQLLEAGHTMLYDLKENVVTPYVMVESLGWFYSLPFLGKTLCPQWYRKAADWLRRKIVPPIATTLTVEKLSREEVEEMLAAEQRAITRRVLQDKFGDRNPNLSLARLEFLRRKALDEEGAGEPSPEARATALTPEEEIKLVQDLRQHYGINYAASFARMERITRTGFTLSEQAFTVETVLRIMGLTRNFARLVLFCGHGSGSENNPFEAALDCGACGGNPGKPNARVLAMMANRPLVREQLARNGIVIPQDTYFIAGQHNTTTDDVELFDLEDLPPTHRKDLLQLVEDLEIAGKYASQERCSRFPEMEPLFWRATRAKKEVRGRSSDWGQVRPEWGLSGNAAFIVGRRTLTRGVRLNGRVFLHSYDYLQDPDGRFLELILTGPQIVGQWINMEHYFSAVDPEVYGSGSKIYHNIVGRLGIMAGPQSDLRTGLAWQSVMSGPQPYHEPMRLLTLVEAPRRRLDKVIRNQRHLQQLYENEWLFLIAIEPEERMCYRYVPKIGWEPTDGNSRQRIQSVLEGG